MAIVKLNVGGITDMPPIKLAQLLALDADTQQKLLKMNVVLSEQKDLIGGTTSVVVTAMDPTGKQVHVNTKISPEKLVWATSSGYQLGKGAVQLALSEAIQQLFKACYPGSEGSTYSVMPDEVVAPLSEKDWLLAQILKTNVPKPKAMSIKEATEMLTSGTMTGTSKPVKMKTPKGFHVNNDPSSRVKLRDATSMYEPVFGTAEGSMYHVVALGDGLNAAARIRGNNDVSLRLEGPAIASSSFKENMVNAGFSPSGDTHMSLHVQADSEQHAVMALGAMLASVPFNFEHSAPSLKAILYKGV